MTSGGTPKNGSAPTITTTTTTNATGTAAHGGPTMGALFGTLLDHATAQGTISAHSQTILAGDLGPLVVAGAAGMAVDDIQASEVTLVTVLIDASSSIESRGLTDAVRAGQHLLLDAFAGAREKDAVLVALWTFESETKVVHSYVPVDDATRLDDKSYRPAGCTHLYDTFCAAAGANVAYAQRLRDAGTPVRSVLVVITDGEDVGSAKPARVCKKLASDLLKSEQFLLGFVGVGSDVDFTRVARDMGFLDGSILVQKDATPSGLRQAFAMVSRSAIRASQGRIAPGAHASFFAP